MNKFIKIDLTVILIVVLLSVIVLAATPSWQRVKTIVVKDKESLDTVLVLKNVTSVTNNGDSLILTTIKNEKKVFYPKDNYIWVFKMSDY